jgi:hypothetical protein
VRRLELEGGDSIRGLCEWLGWTMGESGAVGAVGVAEVTLSEEELLGVSGVA